MRIGIDASRAFGEQRTGTEEYSYQIIKHLLALPEAKKHEWILYTRNSPPAAADPSLKSILRFASCDVREGRGVSYKIRQISLPCLWTQVGLAARTWVDKLDVLWIPAHTLPLLRQPSWLREGKPLKTVVTIHGLEYEWLPEYSNWLQAWYLPLSTQYAVLSAQKIIAVSEFTKRQLINRLKADPIKISVIHEGVINTSPSNPSPKEITPSGSGEGRKGGVLKKFGLTPGEYLLFIGTIQPRKNLERLIQAFSGLSSQPSGLRLVIAGKLGWMYDEVLAAPKKWGVEDKVVFTGYINEAERNSLLLNARVYVQPSVTEGFGLPVLEAFAAGAPVVSSKGGALSEIVGEAGLLFDPFDVLDICHKLSLVIRSHSLRKELIKKGRERIKEFGWQMAAERTYKILNSEF